MKHISLKVSDVIKNILPETLEKDLQDNEVICPTCHGLGIVLRNQPFKLDNNNRWFNNEYFTFCPDCYNGVRGTCKYCGKLIPKEYTNKCDCEQYKTKEKEKADLKRQETINKAKEVNFKDVDTMLYCEECEDYFDEIDDFLDSYIDDYRKFGFDTVPKLLWVTEEVKLSIDAGNICESACEELHEDAYEECDIQELQKLLDDWCSKQTGTDAYYPRYKEYVKVDENWFKEYGSKTNDYGMDNSEKYNY